MIHIRNLTKTYPLAEGRIHYVLKDASVDLPPDINIAVLGANGAGKTTLLRLLSGVEEADGGEIITQKTISWPIALRGGLQPHMTGKENCWFVLSIHGYNRETIRARLSSIKKSSGIGEYFDEPVKTYSSGMRARLSFSLCMSFDFDYFLLDEITAVGDAEFKKTCYNWIRAENQRHNIIMVSHDMKMLRKFCSAAILIEDEKMKFIADIETATKPFMND